MRDIALVAPIAGWAMPLAEVPDPVFGEGMMGDGIAIDPVGDTLHAPCDAVVLTLHAAGHAISLRTDAGAELLMHLGIDTVAMNGRGFTALVKAGARVAAGDPLIRFDLDAVVQSARAAVTPIIVTSPGWRIAWRADAHMLVVGEPLLSMVAEDTGYRTKVEAAGDIVRHSLTVGLPHGLHARPAARIVATAKALEADVALIAGDARARCDSPIALLGLSLAHGMPVTIEAIGPDAEAATISIADLLTREVDAAPAQRATPSRAPTDDVPDGALKGVCAAPGLAIGTAHWLRTVRPSIPEAGKGSSAERAHLERGMEQVRRDLLAGESAGSAGSVLRAHRAILNDPALRDKALALVDGGQPAAGAYLAAAEAEAETLRRVADARIAERADDLVDVGLRVAHAILGTRAEGPALPDRAIVLADDLLPSQLIAIDAARLAGIVLARGGPTSHVAILAAGMGVPMLVALGATLHAVAEGDGVLLEADQGYLDPAPDAAALARAEGLLAKRRAAEARALANGAGQTVTADGTKIAVYANLGSAEDARTAAAMGAEGCGLLRTEFLFLDRTTPPDVAEQAESYGAIATALPDRPIVIRLLDVGGDKPAPYLSLAPEENPALGLRGVRVSLARPDILETQLRAILAVPDLTRCRIMVPMVTGLDEILAVRAALDRLQGELGTASVQLGAMVETPAAAIGADLIAPAVDFLSIGSNDLTQYVLAMDRGNPAVAAGIDGLHPAVLRLIAATCDGAARHGVPVSVCGGLAADPLAVPILIGLGVRTLSVPPARIAATKALVASLGCDAAILHAGAALDCTSASQVRARARSFAQELAA